jgi:tetratricopeptide (TPR) repeat protein
MDKGEKAKQLFFEGVNCINNQNFEDAERNFLDSLELVPNKFSVLDNLAVVYMALDKYLEAREIAQKSIKINPKNPISLQNLGLIELNDDKFEEANTLFDEAIKIDPLYYQAINNKAIALTLLNLDEEAIKCCDSAIKINNNFIEAWNNKGDILKKIKRYPEAIDAYEQSIKIKKDGYISYRKKGDLLYQLKRYEESILTYDQALQVEKDRVDVWCNKSLALEKLNRYTESLEACNEGIKVNSNYPELWINKSLILCNLKDFQESLDAINVALLLAPNNPEALNNKALALQGLKKYDEQLICHEKSIELRPDVPDFVFNKANCLFFLNRYEDSLDCANKLIKKYPDYGKGYLSKAQTLGRLGAREESIINFNIGLEKEPKHIEGWNNLGLMHHETALVNKDNTKFSLAKKCYDQAIKIKPSFYEPYFNKSLTELIAGDFKEGWKNYEYRLKIKKDNNQTFRFISLPRIDDLEKIKDKTVMIWSEQGLGDSIQFCRFIHKISELCKNVIFEVPRALVKLMSNQFNCQVIEKASTLFANINYQMPIASLPGLFNTDINNIPFKDSPYLKTNKNKNEEWKKKLNLTYDKPNIGITFSGNSEYSWDRYRSGSLSAFLPLVGKANIFILQKKINDKDNSFLKKYLEIKFIGKDIDDFEDLASVIQNMDFTISTDTSIPHLSAALGKKTYLLLSQLADWRWLLNINYSPWYSSMVVVRKSNISESWENLVKNLIKDLGI